MATSCSTSGCGTGTWTGPLPGDPDNSSVLSATSEFGGIQLSWTLPNLNGFAVAYTKVYRSLGDQFATAIPYTYVAGGGYFDTDAAKLIRPYYYWIRHVSINGTELDPIGPVMASAKPLLDQVIEGLAQRVESSHLAESLRLRVEKIADLEQGLTNVNTLVDTNNSVLAQELLGLRDDLTGALAYIDQQRQIEISEKEALVQDINTQLASNSSELYAAIQEEATTRANETGELFAQKTIKLDVAGNVSGIGMSARLDPDGTATSDFQVRSDVFSLAPPAVNAADAPSNPFHGKIWVDTSVTPNVTKWYNSSTSAWQTTPVKGTVPFIVRTTPQVVDGYTIDPGVYISGAFIDRLTANQIDTRGLSIRDASGNVILSAGTALDWSRIAGTGKPENGATVGAPAGTDVGGVAAETVASKANGALQKAGDSITGRINLQVADGLFAGTDTNTGVYMGSGGIVAKKDGVTTVSIDANGDAYFSGRLAAGSASTNAQYARKGYSDWINGTNEGATTYKVYSAETVLNNLAPLSGTVVVATGTFLVFAYNTNCTYLRAGLTIQYATSTNGGSTWSAWEDATDVGLPCGASFESYVSIDNTTRNFRITATANIVYKNTSTELSGQSVKFRLVKNYLFSNGTGNQTPLNPNGNVTPPAMDYAIDSGSIYMSTFELRA